MSRLRLLAIAEGVSLLVLVAVAMPLKYFASWPLGVRVVGPIHGILFMVYVVALFRAVSAGKIDWRGFTVGMIAAVVPGGTLFVAHRMPERVESS